MSLVIKAYVKLLIYGIAPKSKIDELENIAKNVKSIQDIDLLYTQIEFYVQCGWVKNFPTLQSFYDWDDCQRRKYLKYWSVHQYLLNREING